MLLKVKQEIYRKSPFSSLWNIFPCHVIDGILKELPCHRELKFPLNVYTWCVCLYVYVCVYMLPAVMNFFKGQKGFTYFPLFSGVGGEEIY